MECLALFHVSVVDSLGWLWMKSFLKGTLSMIALMWAILRPTYFKLYINNLTNDNIFSIAIKLMIVLSPLSLTVLLI